VEEYIGRIKFSFPAKRKANGTAISPFAFASPHSIAFLVDHLRPAPRSCDRSPNNPEDIQNAT
jgi:hypothetical protein